MILAGIDIGTNTIRLLIADVRDGSFHEIFSGRIITRLGQDLDRSGILSPEAQERSLTALRQFSLDIASHRCAAVSAVGTSALRHAGNAGAFIDALKERTGLDLRVISGEEEARLTMLGVRRAISPAKEGGADPLDSALVIDIGGGSTELIVTVRGAALHIESMHLGAVYLTDRHMKHDPPDAGELGSLRATVRKELDAWEGELLRERRIQPGSLHILAGTAGTVTTLAAMDLRLARYDAARINGHVLSRTSLDGMIERLCRMTLAERRGLPGLEAGREDIILAGAIICQEIMERTGKQELLVSDWGLREGIVLDQYAKLHRD
jgi:exopolyphosphatase/guanosine-5'-triphosphate,3'-diphosphate pyrophosphatase